MKHTDILKKIHDLMYAEVNELVKKQKIAPLEKEEVDTLINYGKFLRSDKEVEDEDKELKKLTKEQLDLLLKEDQDGLPEK